MQCGLCVFGSVLVDFFNPRVIGVIGGLVSSFSMLLSAQVKEIQFYLLTYGVMLAIGQALLLASTLAILPHYFNKKLSMANGKQFSSILNSLQLKVLLFIMNLKLND